MPNTALIATLLTVYAATMLLSLVIALIMWRRYRIQLYGDLALFWVFHFVGALLTGALQGSPPVMVLGLSTGVPAYVALGLMICRVSQIPYLAGRVVLAYALGHLIFAVAWWAGASFFWYSLPVVLSHSYALMMPALRAWSSPNGRRYFGIRALCTVNLLLSIHMLDYPLLRLSPEFAPYGFGIAFMLLLTYSSLCPVTIYETQQDRVFREEHRAREAAEEASRAKDEFIIAASHELRTPLTSLKLQSDVFRKLAKAGESIPPEKMEQMLWKSDRQIARLTNLSHNLTDLAHFKEPSASLQLEEVDLLSLAREVTRSRERAAQDAKCEILLAGDAGAIGRWDRGRLERVIGALLENALKFGAGKPIAIEISRQGSQARLSIRDEGIGVAPDEQSHIFDRFGRAAPGEFGGLGLSLHVARLTLRAHGGEIRVRSEPGKGAEFTFELPGA